ncbi:MAG: DUF1904 domain-containing protein [Odoribacter sp.]|nr:DUF1904 domain-containing protein [Odoribacter sp.]
MPFFRFHFVEEKRLAEVSGRLTDRIQQAVGCPREHIVLELVHSACVADGVVKTGDSWPFVEVDYFERPREVQHAVARILYEELKNAGYPDSDIHFQYLQPRNYYENGKCLGE